MKFPKWRFHALFFFFRYIMVSEGNANMKILNSFSFEAKDVLDEDMVLALPTETVYGVGIRWNSPLAYERLCECKRRRPDKPIAVMVGQKFDLSEYFEISENAKRVMDKFLPGPLTCLVKAKENAPEQTHLGTYIAGIRIPDKKELLEFLNSLPYPLQVTSANISGQPSLKEFSDVYDVFKDSKEVKAIVKGECLSGTPTTVVSLMGDKPVVIRQGEITQKQIDDVFYKN